MIKNLLAKIRTWLRTSPHVHVREKGVNNIGQLVDLIDRFIDGPMRYPLEWDDFISWEHENHYIENVRTNIGQYERLLFSKNKADRAEYLNRAEYLRRLIEDRNQAAALIGLPARRSPDQEKH